jgi:hypothetical protein
MPHSPFLRIPLVPTGTLGPDGSRSTNLAAAFLVCFGYAFQKPLKPAFLLILFPLWCVFAFGHDKILFGNRSRVQRFRGSGFTDTLNR